MQKRLNSRNRAACPACAVPACFVKVTACLRFDFVLPFTWRLSMTFLNRAAVAVVALGLASSLAFVQSATAADAPAAPAAKPAVHHSAHKITHAAPKKAVKKVSATTTAPAKPATPAPAKAAPAAKPAAPAKP